MAGLLARWLIHVSALVIGRSERSSWRREWQAELWHEQARLRETGGSPFKLVLAALGAPGDAVAFRRSAAGLSRDARGHARIGAQRGKTQPMSTFYRELRQAVRGLARNPGFTFTAVLVLALGLGANAALFTIVNAVLLRPLPYPTADRLVRIVHPVPGLVPGAEWGLSMGGYFYLLDNSRTLDAIAVYGLGAANLAGDGAAAERVSTASVSASMFDVLGAVPVIGRPILPADNELVDSRVAVLSYEFWMRRFGGDPGAVGSMIRLDSRAIEVVGVAPEGLEPPERPADVWLSMALPRGQSPVNSHYLNAIGRMAPGADLAAVRTDLLALTSRFTEALPSAYTPAFMEEAQFTTKVVSLRDAIVGDAADSLWIVFGAVAVVLLIACVNVANLFIVRTEGRRREVAVRSALGANRAALGQVFLAESFALVAAACGFGIIFAFAGVRALLTFGPDTLPRADEITPGSASILFALGLALIVGLLLGLIPLLRFGRGVSSEALREGTGRVATGRTTQRARSALVAIQIAAALVLLAGAGVLARSMRNMLAVETGFVSDGALVFDLVLPQGGYDEPDEWNTFYDGLIRDLSSLSGVTAVGATTDLPLESGRGCWLLSLPTPVQSDAPLCHPAVFVTPGYFEAAGIPILHGREMTWADNSARSGAMVISAALARTLWRTERALDREIKIFNSEPPFFRVAGVAADIRAFSLTEPHTPIAYFPIVPNERGAGWIPPAHMNVIVRTTRSDVLSLVPELRDVVRRTDPEIPITNVRPARRIVDQSMARHDFVLLLLGVAAAVALLLGAVGLYGVIAYLVGQRRNEIGIRLALGASAPEVGRMVLAESARIAAIGLALGLAGALVLTRALGSLLFEVSAIDPVTLVTVCAILFGVLMLASWLPARRATRMDPAQTLRAS